MAKKQTYAVLGLGRYGSAVAQELCDDGAEVMVVDKDENVINAFANKATVCKCADVTDIETLRQLGISNVDVVVIAFASHLEASVMAIMLCKEVGVKQVIAKCDNEIHGRILSKVGADRIIFPEHESGVRLAKNLLSSGFLDLIELAKDVSMLELDVRPEWVGKTVRELEFRKKYAINIVAICEGKSVSITIDPETSLNADMRLIVITNPSKLGKLI